MILSDKAVCWSHKEKHKTKSIIQNMQEYALQLVYSSASTSNSENYLVFTGKYYWESQRGVRRK